LALEAGDREFRSAVERFFAASDDTPDDVAAIVAAIAAHGGVAKTEAVLAGHVERAKQSLAPLGTAPARSELAALADALL
jgi:geranylgeranyl pyrophosphate synthase